MTNERQEWNLGNYRDFVWKSRLCRSHKLLVLAVLSFINEGSLQSWPNQVTLGQRASMSRSTVNLLLRDLKTYDWLRVGLKQGVGRPGAAPSLYRLPRDGELPQVPPHCSLLLARSANLKRGNEKAEDA